MVPLLRPTKIRYYVNAMVDRGYSPATVLAGSGISPKRLHDSDLLIDTRQCAVVINNMIRLTDNPALGFEIGSEVQLTDFGILAHAMMSSRTMRQAAALWLRFYNLVGMIIHIKFEESEKSWVSVYDTHNLQDPVLQFCVEEMVMIGIKLGTLLVDKPFMPDECSFAYPAPAHASRYRELLSCPIHFNAARNSMTIHPPLHDAPLRGNDPEFNEICLRHCSQIMRQINASSPIKAQLRSLLLGCPGNIPSLAEAAKHLDISPRSLSRHLLAEGSSYQALVEEFRLDLAREYLLSEHLTPKEVGYLLGFRNISAFRRAFKTWTGKTIQEFRDQG